MNKIIEIPLEDNNSIYIELCDSIDLNDQDSISLPISKEKRIIQKSKDYLDNSLYQIAVFANNISERVRKSDLKPDEFEVEFAVKFSADVGVIFSSLGAETNVNVKLKWKKDKEE